MPEKEKPSISQEDFIKKYYGDKILDRIDEIASAEIGDEDKLFSIYEKIKKKKEFDADEIQYLMDCSEELDEKGTELPTNKKKISRALLGDNPSSPLYTKGTFGFYGKRNVGKRKIVIAVLACSIVLMFLAVGAIKMSDDEEDIGSTYTIPYSCIDVPTADLNNPNTSKCMADFGDRIRDVCQDYVDAGGTRYSFSSNPREICLTSNIETMYRQCEEDPAVKISVFRCYIVQMHWAYQHLTPDIVGGTGYIMPFNDRLDAYWKWERGDIIATIDK